MNYAQSCKRLKQTAKMGSKLGLDSIRQLCDSLGNPQDKLRIIHVAGTNGKGSVCAMLSSVFTAAGYRTGLYTSPFLKDYRDSFAVNGKRISPAGFAAAVSIVFEHADRLNDRGIFPTEFEILTTAAFVWFCEQICDIVVLETGLGGRLDATNVAQHPLISVITAVSMDHMEYLGPTLEQIAREKCGIIKPGGITVSYPVQEPQVLRVIQQAATEHNNTLVVPDATLVTDTQTTIGGTSFAYRDITYQLSMSGRHQAYNAVTAIETINVLQNKHQFNVTQQHLAQGLLCAYQSARQEVLAQRPLTILDGAHNVQGICALADTLSALPISRPLTVIMGILRDKEYDACIRIMASLCDRFIAVRPRSPRALSAKAAASVAAKYSVNVTSAQRYDAAIAEALSFSGENGAVVICGSLYMANAMRRAVLKTI